MYISTKTYGHEIGLSCAFRQWKAESHCRFLHGYALRVRIEFGALVLDDKNWVVDFGGLKVLKERIAAMFDHTTVIASDDPLIHEFVKLEKQGALDLVILPATGCEFFSRYIHDITVKWLHENNYGERCKVLSVEVAEHGANSAIYKPTEN